MARTYIHLSSKNVEDSLLSKVYGIKVAANNPEDGLKVCSKCNEVNPHFSRICNRCKTSLDEKEIMQNLMSEEKMQEIESWSKKMMVFLKKVEKRHPDIWEDMEGVLENRD